ncbi:unnamed protein product [Paramecium primaurelia]|uniref:Transmembrane protein n=1 Tax=Paramecium primaurelia TaxID=5886 RepID=A0A8S1PE16_PARPR|nr:unnamed protein product [Paramecium primaurelia]
MKLKEFLIKNITQENDILENMQSDFNISSNKKKLQLKNAQIQGGYQNVQQQNQLKVLECSKLFKFQFLSFNIINNLQYIQQKRIIIHIVGNNFFYLALVVEIILRIFIFINNNKNEKYQ